MDCSICCVLSFVIGTFILYKIIDYVIRIPKIGNLRDRYVLVTGADTGFGHEIAVRLDAMGCNVFAGCLTEKGEDELRKKCSKRLEPVRLDVSKVDSIKDAYKHVKSIIPEGKGLWGIYNNAGICGKSGPIEWMHRQDYYDVLDVNLFGVIDVTATFLPLVKKARGRIINTASIMGRFTLAGATAYCISKYGVETFSDTLRRQLRPFGITVHIIEPGFYKTNITDTKKLVAYFQRAWDEAPKEAQEEYGEAYLEQIIRIAVEKRYLEKLLSHNIYEVVDAYEHALFGRFPRARYVVGNDANYFFLPLQSLPEWLGDWIVAKLRKDDPVPYVLQQKS